MSETSKNVAKVIEEVNKLSADEKNELLLEMFKGFNMMEIKEFTDKFCDFFDVSAAAPVMQGMAPVAADDSDGPSEPTEFNVVLTAIGDKKIQVIKAVRALTGLGLKEAKEVVDNAPKAVKEKVSKEEAEKVQKELEAAGASVEVKGA